MAVVALVLALAYALGTVPTAILVGLRSGHDPTHEGSGNPGATNVYRTAGRRAGALVLAGDLLKGASAAGVGLLIDGQVLGLALGAAAVIGHVFPIQRRFRGGKGVATGAGVGLVIHPLLFIGLALVFLLVAKLTRAASIASATTAVLWPVAVAVTGRPGAEIALSASIGAVVIMRHRSNFRRLRERTENRLGS